MGSDDDIKDHSSPTDDVHKGSDDAEGYHVSSDASAHYSSKYPHAHPAAADYNITDCSGGHLHDIQQR